MGSYLSIAIFMGAGGGYPAAKLGRHGLHSIADTQHRHAQLEYMLGCSGGVFQGYRFRAAGEDYPGWLAFCDSLFCVVIGKDLTEDACFTYPAGDELRILGSEVQDQDAVGMDVGFRFQVSSPELLVVNEALEVRAPIMLFAIRYSLFAIRYSLFAIRGGSLVLPW